MRIAILTFDAFNDLDSLVAFGMLNRIALLGDTNWQVRIASPTPRVTSMNGLTIDAHEDLSHLAEADAVLVGSGMKTREVANTPALMDQLRVLNPARQLLAAQCSGTYLLGRLGLLGGVPACTDLTSKPWVVESGVDVVPRAFAAHGNVATAGGCLASQYLVAWLITPPQRGGGGARSAALLCAGGREAGLYRPCPGPCAAHVARPGRVGLTLTF